MHLHGIAAVSPYGACVCGLYFMAEIRIVDLGTSFYISIACRLLSQFELANLSSCRLQLEADHTCVTLYNYCNPLDIMSLESLASCVHSTALVSALF